jgi:hypothetical protein
MSFVVCTVALLLLLLSIPVRNRKDSTVEIWTDEDIMIVDDNQLIIIVNVFVAGPALEGASRFSNATEGDIVEWCLFIKIACNGGAGFQCTIVCGHVESNFITVNNPRTGSQLELESCRFRFLHFLCFVGLTSTLTPTK